VLDWPCQGQEIQPIPKVKRQVLEICILYDTSVSVLLFCPTFKMFLDNPIFSRYIKKFLVTIPSGQMTKGYKDVLLSYQIFFISRAKFSML